jgi:DNA-binding transcriptional LysR family regulator
MMSIDRRAGKRLFSMNSSRISNNLSLRQIRAFVAIADQGGFKGAASSLNLSQSALSGSLKELEETLGVKLIHRTTRTSQLSSVGQAFLPFARRILSDVGQAVTAIDDWKKLKGGTVRVATPQLMACTLMPDLVAAFADEHPLVRIQIVDSWTDGVIPLVIAGEVDMGIGVECEAPAELEAATLMDMPLIASMKRGHPLTKRIHTTWEELARFDVVVLRGDATRELNLDLAAAGKPPLRPAHEVAFVTTALGMVHAGLGVTLCMPYAQSMLERHDLEYRLMCEPIVNRRVKLWNRRDRALSPAASAFKNFLSRCLSSAQPDSFEHA